MAALFAGSSATAFLLYVGLPFVLKCPGPGKRASELMNVIRTCRSVVLRFACCVAQALWAHCQFEILPLTLFCSVADVLAAVAWLGSYDGRNLLLMAGSLPALWLR